MILHFNNRYLLIFSLFYFSLVKWLLFFPFVLCIFLQSLILGQRSNKKKIGIEFLDIMHAQLVKKVSYLLRKSRFLRKQAQKAQICEIKNKTKIEFLKKYDQWKNPEIIFGLNWFEREKNRTEPNRTWSVRINFRFGSVQKIEKKKNSVWLFILTQNRTEPKMLTLTQGRCLSLSISN